MPPVAQCPAPYMLHFIRYREAADLLMGVIRLAPNTAEPYHTLGVLHEAMGDKPRALDFYMVAAHLTPKVGKACVSSPSAFQGVV